MIVGLPTGMPATAWFETNAGSSTEVLVIAGSGDETGGPSPGSSIAALWALKGPQTQRNTEVPAHTNRDAWRPTHSM